MRHQTTEHYYLTPPRAPKRLLNRSILPAVSRIFCLPV